VVPTLLNLIWYTFAKAPVLGVKAVADTAKLWLVASIAP
jgi:hypothetical protein